MQHAALVERVENRVHDRRHGADRAELAAAFDAEEVGPARHAFIESAAQQGQLVGARHAVVHEGSGKQLPAVLIVDRLLVQGLADALRNAALDLSFDDYVIDDPADVVATDDASEPDLAGLRIDLDFAGLGAVGPGRRRGGLGSGDAERLFRLARRELGQPDGAVGAGNPEGPIAILDVARGRLERLRRKLLAARNGLAARGHHGRAAHESRARSHAAYAIREVGVALNDMDFLNGDSQYFGEQLGIRGFQPLPHRLRAGERRERAIGADPYVDRLGRKGTGPFQVDRQPPAPQPPAAARLLAPRRETLPVGQLDKPVDDAREIAAVVDIAEVRAIRKILRPDEIAPPNLYGVEPHLARGFLHQPLHEIVRLRPAGPAVGAGGHAVGQHRLDAVIHGGNVVDSRLYLRAQRERNDRRGADRQRADVAEHFHAQSEDAAVAVERQPCLEMLVAPHVRREELLAALAAPFHRPPELLRRVADQRVLGREPGLPPEAAADVADDYPELCR